MGKLRETSKWPDDDNTDKFCTDERCSLDCPARSAQILLDDIEQKIITDMGLDLDKGLYMYKIEPYPESHHI